jgi:putative adhesin
MRKTLMRHRFLIFAGMVAPFASVASQQKVSVHHAATPTVSVRLGGNVSSVKVIGWDRDSVSLVGSLGAGSRMDGGIGRTVGPVTGMKFFVNADDEVSARANKLELYVPKQARVWVKAGSADIEATGVTGGLDLNIVGGSVRVNASPRELLIESMDGAVVVSGSSGYARIKTATGDITVQGQAEDLLATTVSGSINVNSGAVERGRFESVTGPIVFASDIRHGGEARFDTHSGAIELRLARRMDVEIDAASVTGQIENTWTSARPIAGREGRGMELGTSSGMGGARVSIRSFKGNVRLAAK